MKTLNDIFFRTVDSQKDKHVLYPSEGKYLPISSAEMYRQVACLSLALRDLGVSKGSRVVIFCDSSYKWAFADFAILTARAVTVTVYPTLMPTQVATILNKSGCEAAFVGNSDLLGSLLSLKEQIPALKHHILMEGESSEAVMWDDLLKRGEDLFQDKEDEFREEAGKARSEDVATILFTSGTTGDPKGVVLTHGNIVSNVFGTESIFDFGGDDTALIFLPLSHILERMVDFVYWYKGMTMAYALSLDTLGQHLLEIRPTIFTAVPRMYEKMFDRVMERVREGSALNQRIFSVAEKVARQASEYIISGESMPLTLKLKHALMDKLVYKKIRNNLGGRLKFCMTGGAALNVQVGSFFIGAGIHIMEGYGLTETSPVLAVNTFEERRLGTVGKPLKEVEIKIAEDGEILAKGPNVFQVYYEDEEATREAFTEDGFFKTGDVGILDQEGYLKITDRKKDLIVTAGGKNIAPLPVEEFYKRDLYVAQAVMFGNERPYTIMLIVPEFEALVAWAANEGISWEKREDLLKNQKTIQLFDAIQEERNSHFARYEQPKRYALLDEEFTFDNGLITPTQKVKRRAVADRFAGVIEETYR